LINLIQEQRLAIRRSEGKARAFFFGFAAVAVGSVAVYGLLVFESEGAQGEASRLRNLLRKNQPLVQQIDQNKKDAAMLAPRLKSPPRSPDLPSRKSSWRKTRSEKDSESQALHGARRRHLRDRRGCELYDLFRPNGHPKQGRRVEEPGPPYDPSASRAR